MKKYISIEDISYHKGDKIKIHFEGAGFITTGGQSLRFTLPMDRPVSASSAKLSGALTLRQNGIYVYGDANEDTLIDSLNQSCQGISAAGISFSITKTDKYKDCTNNDSVGILFNGTIEFI